MKKVAVNHKAAPVSTAAKEPASLSPIDTCFKFQREEVENLQNAIRELRTRLEPVLSSRDKGETLRTAMPYVGTCSLAQQLHQTTGWLSDMHVQVREILEELEL